MLDRRQQRTREAIRKAFLRLVGTRRYEDITVSDLIRTADIGKSTFYEHYRSKDEVLHALMDGMLRELAEAAAGSLPRDRLCGLLGHFWENRRLGKAVFGPQLGPAVRRRLAEWMVERSAIGKAQAAYLSAAQIGLLFAWLTGEVAADPDDVAEILLSR